MTCQEFNRQLDAILDTQWVSSGKAPSIPRELLEHAQLCESCAATLRATEAIGGLGEPPKPPEGMVDRITETIMERARSEDRRSRFNRWTMGVAAAAVLVLASVFATTLFFDRGAAGDSSREAVIVRLQLEAPQAQSVAVVGDWNEWDPEAHRLSDANDDGIWEIEIEVTPDQEYRYQFLLDGESWVPDPSAPITVDDGFGGENSVLNV